MNPVFTDLDTIGTNPYHEPAGYIFMHINKPIIMKIDLNPYPNEVKIHQISGIYWHLYLPAP
jgi:hypothetical protein